MMTQGLVVPPFDATSGEVGRMMKKLLVIVVTVGRSDSESFGDGEAVAWHDGR
jgi:hypothetical protein